MKSLLRCLIWLGTMALVTNCSQLVRNAIKSHPDIVFEAIKEDPAGFMKVVRTAAQEAQKAEMMAAKEEEETAREEEFKNPKKPEIGKTRAILGEASAPVTIVEYSDFQCPFCQKGADTMTRIIKDYKGKVRLLFKHLPLEGKHPNARRASEYFEAIAMQDQGKAYKFKSLVFKNQNETYGKAEKLYKRLAQKAGANMARLKSDLKKKSSQIAQIIDGDMQEASKFGFQGTPGYLVNGVSLKGAYPYEIFKQVIDRHLKETGAK